MKAPALLPPAFLTWFAKRKWQAYPHQLAMVNAFQRGESTLLIAPTGGGKTLAGFLPTLVDLAKNKHKGLHTLYISPLKALAADIHRNLQAPIAEMGLDISVELRTGDTSSSRRQRQIKKPPHILLTTPESLELLLSYPNAAELMGNIKRIIIDEAHVLAPGKRGHLTSLCLSHLKRINPALTITGLSATVADPRLLADWLAKDAGILYAQAKTAPVIQLMETETRVPWSGYMGTYAIHDIYEAVKQAGTTLIFVNTRAQAELLFQQLWEINRDELPVALHHGSLERDHRQRVEALMNAGGLRAIVATASLDLGLDWGAVDLVIHVGGPRSISRLLQRIGRSNHRLDVPSEAILVPCNRFEMIECIAVMQAITEGVIDGEPLLPGTLDVLAQFVMNSACGEGFDADVLYSEIIAAHPYRHITRETFERVIAFVANGGYALRAYDRFQRIALNEEGRWIASPVAVKRHRMNTGTIVEYETLRVALRNPRSRKTLDLGQIEEFFIQGLQPGDTFLFAGRLLRYKGIYENRVEVEKGTGERPKIPSFKGGRLPLSISVAERVRAMIEDKKAWKSLPVSIQNWLAVQEERSVIPGADTLLAESFIFEKNDHLVLYSFAGRSANQTLGMLLTYHMEQAGLLPLGFVANDYALAVWGLKPVENPGSLLKRALSEESCDQWIETSQMSRRAFRDVAIIAGLVERRAPGKKKTGKQVTISTDLIYDVLRKYEPGHILLTATREDVMHRLADIDRLRDLFRESTVNHRKLEKVSPFAVPLLLEISVERIKGKGEVVLLTAEAKEAAGDALMREASAA